jgi:hypothetical protein
MLLYTVLWLTVALFLYNPLFRFLLIDKAKATPIEKTVVAILAVIIGTALCFITNAVVLLWKNL